MRRLFRIARHPGESWIDAGGALEGWWGGGTRMGSRRLFPLGISDFITIVLTCYASCSCFHSYSLKASAEHGGLTCGARGVRLSCTNANCLAMCSVGRAPQSQGISM